MDVKKMLQNGFEKVTVALLVGKDRNGKSHITVVDTPEHAKEYKASEEMRLATMYRLPPEPSATSEAEKWKAVNEQLYKEMSERIAEERKIAEKYAIKRVFEDIEKTTAGVYNDFMFNRDNVGMNAHYVVQFSDEIDVAIAELKKKHLEHCSESGWISVSEKLPTENGKYWCAYKDSRGNDRVELFEFCAVYNAAWDVNSFNVGKFTIFDGDCFVPVKVQVTHWQHYFVPEAPNAKRGEEYA